MKHHQEGTTAVEFALIAALFFTLLLGVIEVSRALFVWNTLTEATRRGARVAVVCPVNSETIARVAVFGSPSSGNTSPIISGMTTANVQLRYLDQNGIDVANPSGTGFTNIRYVRVQIKDYQMTLLIPFLSQTLNALPFETTLPRESLGVVPEVGTLCTFPNK